MSSHGAKNIVNFSRGQRHNPADRVCRIIWIETSSQDDGQEQEHKPGYLFSYGVFGDFFRCFVFWFFTQNVSRSVDLRPLMRICGPISNKELKNTEITIFPGHSAFTYMHGWRPHIFVRIRIILSVYRRNLYHFWGMICNSQTEKIIPVKPITCFESDPSWYFLEHLTTPGDTILVPLADTMGPPKGSWSAHTSDRDDERYYQGPFFNDPVKKTLQSFLNIQP